MEDKVAIVTGGGSASAKPSVSSALDSYGALHYAVNNISWMAGTRPFDRFGIGTDALSAGTID